MITYVALLRGINVGGNNKVDMKKLKISFEKIGLKNVVTYINSGNIIFDSHLKSVKSITNKIEGVIEKDFKLSIRVVLRSDAEIRALIKKIPKNWKNDSEYKTDVWFLWDEYRSKDTLGLLKINKTVDKVSYYDGVIVWRVKKKDFSKSKMNEVIKTKIYKHITVRNINTVRKIEEIVTK